MHSQLTVRLPDDLEREMSDYAKRLRLKRSDIVRMALERFLKEDRINEGQRPYGRVQGLIGAVESGIHDLGLAHRKHMIARIKKSA